MAKPIDLFGDPTADALTIEAEHAQQQVVFDGAAAAHALFADRDRWNGYVALARRLGFGTESEAVVFCAAAEPPKTFGRESKDLIATRLDDWAKGAGHGPYSWCNAPVDDPTDGAAYDIAVGLDHHRAELQAPRTKAPGPAVGHKAAARTLRERQQERRHARAAGQGFFAGLGFRAPHGSGDDVVPGGV